MYYVPEQAGAEAGVGGPAEVLPRPGLPDHCIRLMSLLIICLTFLLLWKTS